MMAFSASCDDRKPFKNTIYSTFHRPPPPPPRLLLTNKFTESRSRELESLHAIVSDRLNHNFCLRRDNRRRTAGFQSGKNRRRKRSRLTDVVFPEEFHGGTDADDVNENEGDLKNKKPSRRIRRRLSLRSNPDFGFCLSEDGTKRLRTHLWHAKRFTMVKRWGFYLPLGLQGRGRGSRAVLKRLKSGVLLHDASYNHPVQLEGSEEAILDVMSMVLRPCPSVFSEQMSKSVVNGARYANSMLYHVISPHPKCIAPVIYLWLPLKRGEIYVDSEQLDGHSSFSRSECSTSRKLWIWLHPAAYNEGFDALKCACQKEMNETGTSVSCLSMQGHIARLEVIGAKSLKILQKILIPIPECRKIGSQSLLSCSSLSACSNSQLRSGFILEHADNLPPHAIFSLEVQDPRDLALKEANCFPTTASSATCSHQVLPHDSTVMLESTENKDMLFSSLSKPEANGILSDCRQLWDSYLSLKPPLPEDVICRKKHFERLKQFYLFASHSEDSSIGEGIDGYDQSCPIILLRHSDHGTFNSGWSIILPLNWVKTFWMSLILNKAQAIGLREKRWIACSGGLPSFPYDFPDSRAFSSLLAAEAAKSEEAFKLRPPAVRSVSVPETPQWHCVDHTLHKFFSADESCDNKQSSYEHIREPCNISIVRTSNDLNDILEKGSGVGPVFVRVRIHAFKEGSFEEGAIVCAPALADLPAFMSRSEEHSPLQMPQSFIESYFTRQSSEKWELNVPQDSSVLQWYRWPIGFITTGFVRGSGKPVAIAFCEAKILKRLKEQQQGKEMNSAVPEIFVLVRNLKSNTFRKAVATICFDMEDEKDLSLIT